MKNTINKIITVQQFLAEKFIQAQTDLSTISMTQSQLSGITSALNRILSIWDNNSNDDNGSNNESTQPEIPNTPAISVLNEIPGANPNYKALYMTGPALIYASCQNTLNEERKFNEGYYIPVFADNAELYDRKYVLAIKINGEICGYRMLYWDGRYWRLNSAKLQNNEFIVDHSFELIGQNNDWNDESGTHEFVSGDPSTIVNFLSDWTGSSDQVNVQERDWHTLEMLPNTNANIAFLFSISGCTGDASDLNGMYWSEGPSQIYDLRGYYEQLEPYWQQNIYANINQSFVIMAQDEDGNYKVFLMSKKSRKCFTFESNGIEYTNIIISDYTIYKDNIGIPSITLLN